jgi:hypothetical protein
MRSRPAPRLDRGADLPEHERSRLREAHGSVVMNWHKDVNFWSGIRRTSS